MARSQFTESAAAGGAAGLSIVGSGLGLCCIGPWAVALFGVNGAVLFSRLEPFRPFILALAAVLLGWAFWRAYRRPKVCPDGSCAAKRSRFLKAALWFSVALLLIAFLARDLQPLLLNSLQ